MKTKWIDERIKYDGSQLRSLFAYLNYELSGDSVLAWQGPCDITLENMADGEDLLQNAKICGSDMLHFLIEIFHKPLFAAVATQRLVASLAHDLVVQLSGKSSSEFRRDGDDIYWKDKKLSISIAAPSPVSCMIHFAVNVSNEGTPVPTCSLADFNIDPKNLAQKLLEVIQKEFTSMEFATVKVRPLP